MNELTMREKLMLIGLLGVAYDRKVKLVKDENSGPYAHYLEQDMRDIESISDKLVLDIAFGQTGQPS